MDKGHVPRKSRELSGVRGEVRGGRARAGTPTLPGCDSATLEPTARAPRAPRAPQGVAATRAPTRAPRPYLLAAHALHLVQNLIPTYISVQGLI